MNDEINDVQSENMDAIEEREDNESESQNRD